MCYKRLQSYSTNPLQWIHALVFIAPPSYNECKPRGGGDSSSDEEEKNRRKAEKDSDEEGDESGARQSYAPRYMTYNTSDD